MKRHLRFERLLGGKHKASIGQAQGVSKNLKTAIELCEDAAADILKNCEPPRFEVRDGYLIAHQIESSTSSWYFIKHLSELYSPSAVNRMMYPSTYLHPKDLKAAIDSHLAQLIDDRKKDFIGVCPVCLGAILNSERKNGKPFCTGCKRELPEEKEDFKSKPAPEPGLCDECNAGKCCGRCHCCD